MREQFIQSRATPLTCAIDGRSHHITDHAFAAGQGHGYYRALCGHTMAAAAAMASPDRPRARPARRRTCEQDVGRAAGRIAWYRNRDRFADWSPGYSAEPTELAPHILTSRKFTAQRDSELRRVNRSAWSRDKVRV
jgi:hypothetical protein